ncbi:MAG: anthranilate phosphoribosyltransferase [Elusimicrobiota bacterium]|nr:anthranilate phosphoribosyltransferase [Endomicrobiia bacterium]MDW8165041.1 anthranilate phosphoribosyltransferase [Elusimicrobiota bacterium]
MIKEAIQKVVNKEDLKEQEMIEVMTEIMSGLATEAQIASFITALRMKKETPQEITAAVKVLRQFMIPVRLIRDRYIDKEITKVDYDTILDTCGTGGDSSNTFNISTAVAFVVSGCGVFVAKHGNRSISSLCGSADVVEQLGIKLEITKEQAEKCLSEIGIVFLFAPLWHPAMKYAIGPRRQIGIRTIFNIIGPLSNPAFANAQVLGVYSEELVKIVAEVLKNLNIKHGFVVYGKEDRTDEISITGETIIAEIKDGKIDFFNVYPEKYGIKRASLEQLRGSTPQENAKIILDILSGKEKGPKRDVVLLNSAFALLAANKVKSIEEGIKLAIDSIEKGYALRKLELLKKYTNE